MPKTSLNSTPPQPLRRRGGRRARMRRHPTKTARRRNGNASRIVNLRLAIGYIIYMLYILYCVCSCNIYIEYIIYIYIYIYICIIYINAYIFYLFPPSVFSFPPFYLFPPPFRSVLSFPFLSDSLLPSFPPSDTDSRTKLTS